MSDDDSIQEGQVFYSFLEEIYIPEDHYLYLKYFSESEFVLAINDLEYLLPASNQALISFISFDEISKIQSFSIKSSSESNSKNHIIESGVISGDEIVETAENLNSLYFSDNEVSLYFEPLNEESSLKVVFESGENSSSENIQLHFKDLLSYSIKSRAGLNPYWIYGNISENPIDNFKAVLENAAIKEVLFDQYVDENQAIPIDLEEFVHWNRADWRFKDYEIFSWDLFPDILLIDTADYRTQAAFFKRLAFFVEKKGFAGELLSDEMLESLHGWNAHDYRAVDLASFFNEAEQSGFVLNEYERTLKDTLIANGILKKTGNRVRPLGGGVVSISRESTERLRWLFLSHECYHGLFFSSEEYVRDVYEIWNDLAEEQKEFWRIFLDLYGYNINDEYLLVNEFQAYSMQQDTSLADSYFRSKINWIIEIRPYLKGQMERLLTENESGFSKSALLVEKSAFSLTGIKAGDLVLKRKK